MGAQVVKVAGVWYSTLDTSTPGQESSGIGSSTDLLNWTVLYQAPMGVDLQNILHIGGNFLVLGSKDEVVTSPDGTTWTSQPIGTFPDLNQVVFNGLVYVGVDTLDSKVFYSHDGVAWAPSFTLPAREVTEFNNDVGLGFAAAAPGGTIVIVGGGPVSPYSFASTDGVHWARGEPIP